MFFPWVIMKVVLAEKPSVARDIASFLGAKTRSVGRVQIPVLAMISQLNLNAL